MSLVGNNRQAVDGNSSLALQDYYKKKTKTIIVIPCC